MKSIGTSVLLRSGAKLTVIVVMIMAMPTLGLAVQVPIDTTSTSNGISDLFSATFDPPLGACTGSDPSWCSFFGGKPGPSRAIVITPTPTGVATGVPVGFLSVPAAGSNLNLALNGSNTQLTLTGGTIAFPPLTLTIQGTTVVSASGAGIVFDAGTRVTSVNAEGQAEFLVNLVPLVAADFSTFSTIVGPPNGSCAGSLCALVSILTLDMVRYRLFIDYDPTFTYFTASFIGQTSNNSILSITLDSNAPEIDVTDSRAPANDLSIPFGSVTELTTATQTVTVTNTGNANLLLGTVGGTNPLVAPFALANDTCTGATVLPAATCTFNVRFTPGSTGAFSDSLNIPSNDADEPSVTVAVSGTGTAAPVPNITVTDSVAPIADGLIPFGSAAIGSQLNQTVTVTNDGNADLVVGAIAMANPLLAPYSIFDDNCSGQTLAPAGNCTFGVRFEPTGSGATSDTFDIPSNESTVTFSVNGAADVPIAACADFTAEIVQNSLNNAIPAAPGCTGFGGNVTVFILYPPANGTANINSANIVYTPNLGFAGSDTLTYGGTDGVLWDTGVLSITVAPPADTTPDAFAFTDIANQPLSAQLTSNSVTVTGISAPVQISVTGGQYSINGGTFTALPGTVNSGNTVALRQTSSWFFSTTTDATITIGGVSDTFSVTTLPEGSDTDFDEIPDALDNCTLVPNADQRDTNGDGYGNICDPDFNNNGIVDSQDGALLKAAFGSSAYPDRDLNGNGIVDSNDGARLKARFGKPPGPSGLRP